MRTGLIIAQKEIENRIYHIRGLQVMFDSDLAGLFQVETKVLNQAVKRNIERFPDDFMFQLTQKEWDDLKTQFVTSSYHGGRRKLPYVFTEHGVAGLSGILKSQTAEKIYVAIMRAFIAMRKFIQDNQDFFSRLDKIERKQIETDHKFEQVFKALESKDEVPKQGIFFDGQIFDAYIFVGDLIRRANNL